MSNPLPVGECLWLRDKAGMDQTLSRWDWLYNFQYSNPSPSIWTEEYGTFDHEKLLRIPTLPDLMSFAREKAEGKFGYPLLHFDTEWFAEWNEDEQHSVSIEWVDNKQTLQGLQSSGNTLELALVELIKKIMEVE